MESLREILTKEDETTILSAIREAESRTSGEIRIRIEKKTRGNPLAFARKIFKSLGMRDTELHDGVLFVLTIEDRNFIILGDDGIHKKVPAGFWDKVKDVVVEHLRNGQFAKGLVEGIRLSGEQLAIYFPHQKDDKNELPDAISYGDEEEVK